MVLLNKISIDNFTEQATLYSKSIRGNFPFKVEVHNLDNGKKLQIYLYRNIPRIEEFIEVGQEKKNIFGIQKTVLKNVQGVLRLFINDEKFMINGSNATINIKELNISDKSIKIKEVPKGKVAIYIDIDFENGIDNSKVKKELKDYFMEEQNDRE